MTESRITFDHILNHVKSRDLDSLGKASVYLSWNPEGHVAIQLLEFLKLRINLPISKDRVTHEDIFTTEGWLNIVDDTLRDQGYYVAKVTFFGYSGFFRYPEIRGELYKERAAATQTQPRAAEAVSDITDSFDDKIVE
ncbi:hypothetical protein HY485_02690 [Candidatus Woesearchaeota archaeon]|nr:hypothetical protein [Candidatus Woesearchaeota archaeon]